jgi:hypothetical protein
MRGFAATGGHHCKRVSSVQHIPDDLVLPRPQMRQSECFVQASFQSLVLRHGAFGIGSFGHHLPNIINPDNKALLFDTGSAFATAGGTATQTAEWIGAMAVSTQEIELSEQMALQIANAQSRNILCKFVYNQFLHFLVQIAAYQAQQFRRRNEIQTGITLRSTRVIKIIGQGTGKYFVLMLHRRYGRLSRMPLITLSSSVKSAALISTQFIVRGAARGIHEIVYFLQVFFFLFFFENPGSAAIRDQDPGDSHGCSSSIQKKRK